MWTVLSYLFLAAASTVATVTDDGIGWMVAGWTKLNKMGIQSVYQLIKSSILYMDIFLFCPEVISYQQMLQPWRKHNKIYENQLKVNCLDIM